MIYYDSVESGLNYTIKLLTFPREILFYYTMLYTTINIPFIPAFYTMKTKRVQDVDHNKNTPLQSVSESF